MGNLLAELKKRNVFKVATIYVVVSWLLIEVATVVFPVFDIPMWASRLVVILLAIGFPVALIMAWAFDLTPDGIKWQSSVGEHHVHTHAWDWVIATLLVVAIGLMVSSQINAWRDNYYSASEPAPTSATTPDVVDQPEFPSANSEPAGNSRYDNSIAVLPFDSLSPDPDDDYFAAGLAEELLSVLGRIDELKVASRLSTSYFRNREVDHEAIAATLRVENILSGSVRRDGQNIRVTAVLDNVDTGELLWTDTFDRTLDNILGIQTDIARSVVSALVPVLSAESELLVTTRPTDSSDAYDNYLRGLDYLRRPAEETTLASAVELFNRATDIDPRFAEAYAGNCEANLAGYEFTKNSDYFEYAELSCHRALTLNDGLWEVHLALGNLYRFNGQYDRAITELETATRLQQNAVGPYLMLAMIHATQGRLTEAEAMFHRAEEVESGYWRVHNEFGHFLYEQSNYEEAIRRYQRVVELAPDNGIGHDNLGNTYLAIGELDAALQAFDESPRPSRWTYTNRGLVYYYQGEFAKAAQDQQRAIDITPDNHRLWGRIGDAYRFIPDMQSRSAPAYRSAIALVESELAINPSLWENVVKLAIYYAHDGQRQQAEQMLARAMNQSSDETAFYFAAIAAITLGDRERAWTYLRESVDRGFSRALILNDPDLAVFREDPEFIRLMTER